MTIFIALSLISLIAVALVAQNGLSQQTQEEYLPIPVRVDEDILIRTRKRR